MEQGIPLLTGVIGPLAIFVSKIKRIYRERKKKLTFDVFTKIHAYTPFIIDCTSVALEAAEIYITRLVIPVSENLATKYKN